MPLSDQRDSNISKRRRTVEGSYWPCKQRRVKCDLQKPACWRCVANRNEDCSYEKILLRWKKSAIKSVPSIQPSVSNGLSLASSERRAIEYFTGRLWPLFSTVPEPCPPPVALALRSQPVIQALCIFAEERRASPESSSGRGTFEDRRLACLTTVRKHLSETKIMKTSLPALLVAVLLLYFLEGYVKCMQTNALTRCHLAGALAIIDALGGFEAAWTSSDRVTRMLLSEFASTDLTDAMLQDRKPSFQGVIGEHMDPESVWWESLPGTKSLDTVLKTTAEMSNSRCCLLEGQTFSDEQLRDYEQSLQPVYSMLGFCNDGHAQANIDQPLSPAALATLSLIRAFQHAGLIYLYRAIHKISIGHYLVQQHVQACLECVQSLQSNPRTLNCTLFPLYVAGAHAIVEDHRSRVIEALDVIQDHLQFEMVFSIQSRLHETWRSSQGGASWSDIFKDEAVCTLVI